MPSGRIEFVSYGLIVRLQLLPTPPRGDAVTYDYRQESVLPGRDLHPSVHTRSQAHSPATQGGRGLRENGNPLSLAVKLI